MKTTKLLLFDNINEYHRNFVYKEFYNACIAGYLTEKGKIIIVKNRFGKVSKCVSMEWNEKFSNPI